MSTRAVASAVFPVPVDQVWAQVRDFTFPGRLISTISSCVMEDNRSSDSVGATRTTVWKTGALMGTKPEEAFFVVVDRRTMTQNDLDNGKLIVVIGIAPTKPAEFVIFRYVQWAGGSNISELL